MMDMHNPQHPGGILKDVLPELGITVTDAAKQIGVDRGTLSRVINERAAISAEMALKLEDWYTTMGYKAGRARHWLSMQMKYDLWQARQNRAA
jgi:addiction module HigA family antidote